MAKTDLFIAGEGYSQIETLQIPVGTQNTSGKWQASGNIVSFSNTSDATDNVERHIGLGLIAYGQTGKVEGQMPSLHSDDSFNGIYGWVDENDEEGVLGIKVDSRLTQPVYIESVAEGSTPYTCYYLKDDNFTAANIKNGKTIFNLTGTLQCAIIDYLDEDSSSGILTIK